MMARTANVSIKKGSLRYLKAIMRTLLILNSIYQ